MSQDGDSQNPLAVASSSTSSERSGLRANPSNRTSRACSSCSRQKLKCSGEKPCGRCVDLGVEGECIYLPSLRGRMRGKRKTSAVSGENAQQSSSYGMLPPERPDSDYQRWKRSRLLPEYGPRNSIIWRTDGNRMEDTHPARSSTSDLSNTTALSRLPHELISSSSFGNGSAPESSPSSEKSSIPAIHIADRLTTLPLPGDRNPLAVLAEASADVSGQEGHSSLSNATPQRYHGSKLEEGYYEPVERELKDEAPHIMALISVAEAETLFDLYFTHLHPHLPLLDTAHSPPSAVARRNNFLFNAICCASARAFDPTLWSRLADFAKFEMERLPKEKNIDVIQGHCIHAMWNMNPPKNFELDMSWLRTGLAIRTAVDINLHRVALVPEAKEGLPGWVLRAIARTWLGAYIVDQTMSVQLGKASSMRGEQSVRLYIELLRGPTPSLSDLWVAALAEWTQLLSRAVDSLHSKSDNDALDQSYGKYPGGLFSEMGLPDLARVYDQHFKRWRQRVEEEIHACCGDLTDMEPLKEEPPNVRQILHNIRMYQQYATLLIHSFSLERSSGMNDAELTNPLIEIQTASVGVIRTYQTFFDSDDNTRKSAPDILHSFLTYAAVSLLRILQPQYSFMQPDYRSILHTARTAANLLARAPSPLAKSNSTFLNRLIDTKTLHLVTQAASSATAPRSSSNSVDINNRTQTTQRETASSSSQISDPERTLNLEAFGHLLNRDQGRSVWPPLPDSAWDPFLSLAQADASTTTEVVHDRGGQIPPGTSPHPFGFDPLEALSVPTSRAANALEVHASASERSDIEQPDLAPKDLHGWVSRLTDTQDSVYVPAAAIGTGLQNDLLFTQDSFWRSILEGLPAHGAT